MAGKDYYDILGVNENASESDIKRAYRSLAKKYHPDANPGDSSAEARFKDISEAYSVLSNTQKRKKYDQMRKLGAFDGTGGGINFEGFDINDFQNRGSRRGGTSSIFEDMFGAGGLGNIFSSMFDRGEYSRQSRRGPQKGSDAEVEIEIPFDLAITGGNHTFKIRKSEVCSTCNGTGAKPGTSLSTCPQCGGTGTVSIGQGGFSVGRTCPRCYGRGHLVENPCSTCGGAGQVEKQKSYTIKIPQGIESGTKLRLKGQGNAGSGNASAGDLLVNVRVGMHNYFRREGTDIHSEIKINMVQAALGSSAKVKTLDGKTAELKIPAGTQYGRTFRLRGMGINTENKKGDHFVHVNVMIPSKLSEKEKKILKDFAREAKLDI